MSYALAYWIIMLVWLVFGFWSTGTNNWKSWAPNLLLFVLFVLIGLQVFGKPLHQ
jgi:hypothetical protein